MKRAKKKNKHKMRIIGRCWMRKEQNGWDERKGGNKDVEEEQKGRKNEK